VRHGVFGYVAIQAFESVVAGVLKIADYVGAIGTLFVASSAVVAGKRLVLILLPLSRTEYHSNHGTGQKKNEPLPPVSVIHDGPFARTLVINVGFD
jgi:hypothetical protein